MFIMVIYKEPAELSAFRPCASDDRISNSPTETQADPGQEKVLLVNPECYVRVMLEYIRKACKLAPTTFFDLCDDTGKMENLFNYPTFAYCTTLVTRKSYYLIVIKIEGNKEVQIYPQVNRENKLYLELQGKVRKNYATASEKLEKPDHAPSNVLAAVASKTANPKKK